MGIIDDQDEGSDQGVGLLQGMSGVLLPFKCFLSQHPTGSCSSSFMQLLLGRCYGVTQGSILLHGKAYTFCLLDRSRFRNQLAMLSLLAGINMPYFYIEEAAGSTTHHSIFMQSQTLTLMTKCTKKALRCRSHID